MDNTFQTTLLYKDFCMLLNSEPLQAYALAQHMPESIHHVEQ